MFDALKQFITEMSRASGAERAFREDDYRLAAAVLLVHVAGVDGETDPAERQKLKEIIEARFGLDARATRELIEQAEASDRDAVDFYRFTSILKRALDDQGRSKLIEMMWDMAFADGTISEFEENTIWRVAELLGVSTRDRVLSRQRVADEAEAEAASGVATQSGFQGPWGAAVTKVDAKDKS